MSLAVVCSLFAVFSARSLFSSLCALSSIWFALSVLLAPRCPLRPRSVFSLLAVSFFCSLWLSRSVCLSPRCLLLSLWLCSWFLASHFNLCSFISVLSLLVYSLCPFSMLGGPGLSRRRSQSLLLLSLSCLLFFSSTSWRPSQPILVTNILSV